MSVVCCLFCALLRFKMETLSPSLNSLLFSLFLIVELTICFYPTVAGAASISQTQQEEMLSQKKAQLNTVFKLYSALETQGWLDSNLGIAQNETMEYALLGSLEDTINYRCIPREQKIIKDHFVEKLDKNGNFMLYLAVSSLSTGDEYYCLEGVMNEINLKVDVSYRKDLSKKEFDLAKKYHRPKYLDLIGQSYTFNNGSKDIDELVTLCQSAKCLNGSHGLCNRGEVVMDSWLNSTIAFQRNLTKDLPINFVQWVGSHNSFNNRADGYGSGDFLLAKLLRIVSMGKWDFVWAQQYFTITDQLNMGIRYFMLDPVYFWGAMRLCHCGGVSAPWFDKILNYLQKVLHTTFDYDSGDLGCLPNDRLFSAAVQEIRDWLDQPNHKSEVVMVMLNDIHKDNDWNHKNLIWEPVKEIFNELLFTKTVKSKYYPNTWPSRNQLAALDKRVIVLGTSRITNDSVLLDVSVPGWDKDTMKYFTTYPTCQGYKAGEWFTQGGESQVVGDIYNGPAEEGLIVTENYPNVLRCPVSIFKLDLVSPGLLKSSVWSWQEGYSASNLTNGKCAVMMGSGTGRWTTAPCDSTLCYHVCRNSSHVTLSSSISAWNASDCSSLYSFDSPVNGFQNWQIYSALMQNSSSSDMSCAWLNLNKHLVLT